MEVPFAARAERLSFLICRRFEERMDIIICGTGEVGKHAAGVLVAKNHKVTVIDLNAEALRGVEDSLDARTLVGNCAHAGTLLEAGCGSADVVLATTNDDETNLLTATIAKRIGAKKSIARVHRTQYFQPGEFDYEKNLEIDRLICPELVTARAIAQTIRNPGAMAIEHFARGQIEMQQIPVARNAEVIGMELKDIPLPSGTRIAAIGRLESAFIPAAGTKIEQGDSVVLVGDPAHFPVARRFFHDDQYGRRRIVIMGGPPMAVWLCRLLRNRNVSIRLFEINRERAEQLAEQLDWVTVINADPTDPDVFEEERIADVSAFVALAHDEENILGCVLAKSHGVTNAIAVVERSKYISLLARIGIDRSFSPRLVAVKEIESIIDDRPLLRLSSIAEGVVDVYRVRVSSTAPTIGHPLREVKLSPNWIIAAIQRNGAVKVPGANDIIEVGDTLIVIGKHGKEDALRTLFKVK